MITATPGFDLNEASLSQDNYEFVDLALLVVATE